MRLIDVDAFLEEYCENCGAGCEWGDKCCSTAIDLENAPTVNAVEVVHGRWEKSHDAFHDLVNTVCSCCRHTGAKHFKYCPNCGAKMDLK